jgi:heme-degrading monooxygenase HmoA
MIAVIFEVWPAEGRKDDYLNIAHELRAELDRIDGFLSVERFESIYEPGKYNEVEDVTPKWSTAGGQVPLGAILELATTA